jgi:phage terminase small subunit
MNDLTPKQEKFCIEYVKHGNKTEAYRSAYNTSNMKNETIHVKACELFTVGKVKVRIEELQSTLEKKEIYTLEESIKRDLKLIEMYEKALQVLADVNSLEQDVIAANRTIKYISASGYSSAQDRIAKMQGFYEKDNEQSKGEFNIPIINWVGDEDDESTRH